MEEIRFRIFLIPIKEWYMKPVVERISGVMLEFSYLFFQITIYE
jgi:hypothetical protein